MTLSYLQLCVSQVNDISQECNVNRSAGSSGNMEDNINDNFDLPAEIDINLGQLRGGPFDYGNITIDILHVDMMIKAVKPPSDS